MFVTPRLSGQWNRRRSHAYISGMEEEPVLRRIRGLHKFLAHATRNKVVKQIGDYHKSCRTAMNLDKTNRPSAFRVHAKRPSGKSAVRGGHDLSHAASESL